MLVVQLHIARDLIGARVKKLEVRDKIIISYDEVKKPKSRPGCVTGLS